jgi:hypothetical protein
MSQARNAILGRIKAVALGNTRRGLKEVASDLLNELGRDAIKDIEEGTCLSRPTIERVMDCDDGYQPRADTVERIFRYCNASIVFKHEETRPNFANKAKEDV